LRDSGGSSGTGGGHRHGAEGACWRDNDLLNQSPHKSSSESSLIQKNITKKALYCSKKIQKIGTWGSESSLICCTLLPSLTHASPGTLPASSKSIIVAPKFKNLALKFATKFDFQGHV
jgi:hypothetical protein